MEGWNHGCNGWMEGWDEKLRHDQRRRTLFGGQPNSAPPLAGKSQRPPNRPFQAKRAWSSTVATAAATAAAAAAGASGAANNGSSSYTDGRVAADPGFAGMWMVGSRAACWLMVSILSPSPSLHIQFSLLLLLSVR